MFSKYFISTLVFIIVSLVFLFQGEIKEGFVQMNSQNTVKTSMTPGVYGKDPKDGLIANPGFAGWQNGAQYKSVEPGPIDRCGKFVEINRTLGYDLSNMYKSPPLTAAMPVKAQVATPVEERYTPVSTFERYSVQAEASRNMQPMSGGPPRFSNSGSPHLNSTYPIDNARYAVDPANPIVNGCNNSVYSAAGQLQQLNTRENYNGTGGTGGTGGRDLSSLIRNLNTPVDVSGRTKPSTGSYNATDMSTTPMPKDMITIAGNTQPVLIDRMAMPALTVNSKSRLQLGGVDRIRGDIEIIPSLYMSDSCSSTCNDSYKEREYNQWFQVSVKPSRDLVAGYIGQHNMRGKEAEKDLYAVGVPQIFKNNRLLEFPGTGFGTEEGTNGVSMTGYGVQGRDNAMTVGYGTDIEVASRG